MFSNASNLAKGQDNYVSKVNMIPLTREGLMMTARPWIIENVPGAPLENPITLCGSYFKIGVRRHRLFESGEFNIKGVECDHKSQPKIVGVYGKLRDKIPGGGKTADSIEEAISSVRNDLTEKVDDYLSYVVEQWMADNEIAIESGLRSELTDDFIAGLRNLFAEHYIDVPAEKVDLVDELAGKVEELESKLNEEIERGVDLNKQLIESRKVEITRSVCEGLTETQVEKIKSLAESVEFSTEDEYKEKIETIRENYFPSGIKKADEQQLHEKVEDAGEQKVINDPFVAAVSNAISKTKF